MKMKRMLLLASLIAATTLVGCGKTENGTENTEVAFDTEKEISVVSREEGSGTRGAFVELFDIEQKDDQGNKVDYTTEEANISNSTSVVMTTVSGNEYGIGYISLGSLNDTVKAIKIDDAEPSVENIVNGSYKIARPFYIATKGLPSDVAQDFMYFIRSTQGATIINENGYIAGENTQDYISSNLEGKVVIAGSSSVSPIMEKLKEAYAGVNPNVNIEIQQSDSTTGMQSTADGICDIGMASRELKDSEIEKGLHGQVIAMDGIAVVVNKENPTENLTAEQVREIFMGNVTQWSEVAK